MTTTAVQDLSYLATHEGTLSEMHELAGQLAGIVLAADDVLLPTPLRDLIDRAAKRTSVNRAITKPIERTN